MNTAIKNDFKVNIEQIKLSFSLRELCEEHGIHMKKIGQSYRGLCPFHTENSPSFFVSEKKKLWKCFGCGKSGDVINLYSQLHHISNKQSIKILSNLLGLNNTGRFKVEALDLARKRAEAQEQEDKFRTAFSLLISKLDELVLSFKTMIASFETIEQIEKNAQIYHEYARLKYLQEQVFDVTTKEDENEMYFILKEEFLHYKPLLSFMNERGLI